MIVATAGHVDHGKTTLVRALTGVETDRLPEERRRGMSIDLGFAWSADGRLGVVDVPGHARFVGNMLAGVAGIDAALLVVAADDGPMPQTREHLAILAGLGVARCVVALTKVDRVDAVRRAAARAELDALLDGGPHAGAPVIDVAAPCGTGIAALREALDAVAATLSTRPADGGFRLAVDRSFVLAGIGRIATGAVQSGVVRIGDTVVLSPRGTSLRVRGLHAQGRPAEVARAGERCALHLAGAASRDAAPARGDWLVDPALHAPTDRLDVRLAGRLQARGARWHLHLGAAAVPVRVVGLGADTDGWAQLVLDRPVAALHGDRFVLREPAAGSVVGGIVVDPFAPARGRSAPARLAALAALAAADAGAALDGALGAVGSLAFDRFVLSRNLAPTAAEALRLRPRVTVVATGDGPQAVAAATWRSLGERIVAALDAWHAARPDDAGPGEAALLHAIGIGGPAALARAALAARVAAGEVVRDGFRLRRPDHRARLSADDAALLARIVDRLVPTGLRPPIAGELACALGVDLPRLREVVERAGPGRRARRPRAEPLLPAGDGRGARRACTRAGRRVARRLRCRGVPRPHRHRPQPDGRGAAVPRPGGADPLRRAASRPRSANRAAGSVNSTAPATPGIATAGIAFAHCTAHAVVQRFSRPVGAPGFAPAVMVSGRSSGPTTMLLAEHAW